MRKKQSAFPDGNIGFGLWGHYSPINNKTPPLNVESGQMFVQAVLLFQVFSEFWAWRFYYFCSKMDRFLAFSPCKTAKTRFFSARFARQFFFGGFIIPSFRSNVWAGGFIEGGGFNINRTVVNLIQLILLEIRTMIE